MQLDSNSELLCLAFDCSQSFSFFFLLFRFFCAAFTVEISLFNWALSTHTIFYRVHVAYNFRILQITICPNIKLNKKNVIFLTCSNEFTHDYFLLRLQTYKHTIRSRKKFIMKYEWKIKEFVNGTDGGKKLFPPKNVDSLEFAVRYCNSIQFDFIRFCHYHQFHSFHSEYHWRYDASRRSN